MELGHLLTRSGLTYPEVYSKVYHDSFCQLGSRISLPSVIYFEAFYLQVVSSFSCIPVICPKLVLFLTPLQFVHLCILSNSPDTKQRTVRCYVVWDINPLNAKLNPICHLLALLGAHHILHVKRVRVKSIRKHAHKWMRNTNCTLQRVINICHSLNTEQIKVQISRKSTLCSVRIICALNQDSGKCASCKAVFLNRRAATRYRALAWIIPGRERFSWNLSF